MSYEIYKIIHFAGILLVFLALGGLVLNGINAGGKEFAGRRFVSIGHGVGMLLVLLGGFGMLARLVINWPWPGWVMVKVGVWLALGFIIVPLKRSPGLARLWWLIAFAIGVLAAYVAVLKPGC